MNRYIIYCCIPNTVTKPEIKDFIQVYCSALTEKEAISSIKNILYNESTYDWGLYDCVLLPKTTSNRESSLFLPKLILFLLAIIFILRFLEINT